MAEAEFRLNRAGLREIFRSQGMQDALMGAAQAKAGEANGRARTDAGHGLAKSPYEAYTRVLGGTAIGAVSTTGREGAAHEARHHTLSGTNH